MNFFFESHNSPMTSRVLDVQSLASLDLNTFSKSNESNLAEDFPSLARAHASNSKSNGCSISFKGMIVSRSGLKLSFSPQQAEQACSSENDTIQCVSTQESAAVSRVPNKADLHTDLQ